MPAETISVAAKKQFAGMLFVESNQNESYLQPYAAFINMEAEETLFESLGSVDPIKLEGTNETVQPQTIEWTRRKFRADTYASVLYVDKKNTEDNLLDPTKQYAAQIARGMKREKDRILLAAATASVLTGKEGKTEVSAATDGVVNLAMTSGITTDLILQLRNKFKSKEVEGPYVWAVTEQETKQMLLISTITSSDYTKNMPLDNGEISHVHGMKLVEFGSAIPRPMLNVATSTRTNIAFAKDGIALGMKKEAEDLLIEHRPDLHLTHQVIMYSRMGAVRTVGNRVVTTTSTAT